MYNYIYIQLHIYNYIYMYITVESYYQHSMLKMLIQLIYFTVALC